MKHISILIPRGAASLGCIEGAHKMFHNVNNFLADRGDDRLFQIQLVGISRDTILYDGFARVSPDRSIQEHFDTDLIIIPAVNGNFDDVIAENSEFFPWIRQQYQLGSEVSSLCVGAFLLAATGLLEGKKCSTHWQAEHVFRKMFPDVDLVSDKIITDENGIYSSGGANSFWNLLLYLVEKYTDREMAIFCAKYFAIEIDRFSQSPFIMFRGQRDHLDEEIKRAQDYIEQHFQDRISVDQLAALCTMGRRSFERRFKKATSNTVSEYIQRVKVEAAKKGFETSRKNINEVMCEVGYADNKAFRTIFKRKTGLSPVEYRNKYNKEAIAV
jgi:transcriptional regulator GlxA family with amidase domain